MKRGPYNYFGLIALIFFVAITYVWEQIESVRMQYKIDKLNEEKIRGKENLSDLQILCYKMESLDRLDEIAKKMKFITPKNENVICLDSESRQIKECRVVIKKTNENYK
ncbi:MAG: hypothetical protein A3J83_06980 [Elusimicrobia bacterium RIFOXYA2_FULL_40_6]|nr:MAG: hypothetical protein A3J83_06980 [Elusimicrobia bacterium RIFOXYA2_FULL_40_6]